MDFWGWVLLIVAIGIVGAIAQVVRHEVLKPHFVKYQCAAHFGEKIFFERVRLHQKSQQRWLHIQRCLNHRILENSPIRDKGLIFLQ